MSKSLKLSSFIIKIIAIVLMTLDHFVIIFCRNVTIIGPIATPLFEIGVRLGAISFPLFAFLINEGMKHTSSKLKYFLRLLTSALILIICCTLLEQFKNIEGLSNIFTDLTIGAAIIWCLEQPKLKKLFVLIPLAVFSLLLVHTYTDILVFDSFKLNYGSYGVLVILGFYFSKYLFNYYVKYISNHYGMDKEGFLLLPEAKSWSNIFACISFIVINLCCLVVSMIYPDACVCTWTYQIWSILAVLIIVFYNHNRGYNKKWFQYGAYLYYSLHLIIMYVIYLSI